MSPYEYYMPTRVIFGVGTLARLPGLLDEKSRALVVVGERWARSSGCLDRLLASLSGFEVTLFEGVPPNPSPETADEAAAMGRHARCDVVIGMGGGSVLDAAKSAAFVMGAEFPTRSYLTGAREMSGPGARFIAVPSTSGTGGEVTPWATLWDMEQGQKYSLSHPLMFPYATVVDPSLMASLSPKQVAISGVDALTHAVEAYWSKHAQPISDAYALQAVRAITTHLERSYAQGDEGSRAAMAQGALAAGLAFSNTRTTVCHSLSYPMTARFGVPHGQAVSITLRSFLLFNAEAIGGRLAPLVEALSASTVDEAAQNIESLMRATGLATRLSELGLHRSDLDTILQEGFTADRADNTPRPVSKEDAETILKSIL